MELQEKIKQRITELEKDINFVETTNYSDSWKLGRKLSLTSKCIKELKQLLN